MPSINAMQCLMAVCEKELLYLDMHENVKTLLLTCTRLVHVISLHELEPIPYFSKPYPHDIRETLHQSKLVIKDSLQTGSLFNYLLTVMKSLISPRNSCTVSIETVAPLQTAAKCEQLNGVPRWMKTMYSVLKYVLSARLFY